jgi:ABC-2 type transport system permease protein
MHKILAFLRRDFFIQASYRLDFIMKVFGILVSIAIFNFISQILGGNINPYLESYGSDYFHFALIGIAFFSLINMSSENLSLAILEYQTTGTLETLFLSPTPILPALLMSTLWSYCWASLEALFFLVAAALLFSANFNWINLLSCILIVLATILANTGIGLINAAFVLVTKRSSPLARLMGLITYLLAGVYYPIQVLPEWLRFFSNLIPSTYSLNALRRALLQSSTLFDVRSDLLALSAFSLVLLPIGLIAFRYAVRWAKIDGSLSQY